MVERDVSQDGYQEFDTPVGQNFVALISSYILNPSTCSIILGPEALTMDQVRILHVLAEAILH